MSYDRCVGGNCSSSHCSVIVELFSQKCYQNVCIIVSVMFNNLSRSE